MRYFKAKTQIKVVAVIAITLLISACSSGGEDSETTSIAPSSASTTRGTPSATASPLATTTTPETAAALTTTSTIAATTSTSASAAPTTSSSLETSETASITPTTTTSTAPSDTTTTTTTSAATTTTTSVVPATTVPVVAELSPSQLQVQVLNGSGIAGAAGRLSASLRDAGYSVLPAANAPQRFGSSAVYYVADAHRDEAELVAEVVEESVAAVDDGDVAVASLPASGQISAGQANVVVLIGRDDLGSGLQTVQRSSGLRRTPDFNTPLPLADSVPRDRYVPGLLDVQIFTRANDEGSDEMKGILNALSGWFNIAGRYQWTGSNQLFADRVTECPPEGYYEYKVYGETYFAPSIKHPNGVVTWLPVEEKPDSEPILERRIYEMVDGNILLLRGVEDDIDREIDLELYREEGGEMLADLYAKFAGDDLAQYEYEDGFAWRPINPIIGTRQEECSVHDYEYLQTQVWPNIERSLEWLGFTPQNVCGAPAGYSFTDLIKPTREFDSESQNYTGDGILTTDRLLELHGGQRINPEANLDFYIRQAVQTAHDHLRTAELLEETETMQIILCVALTAPEGEIGEFANSLYYGGFIPGVQPLKSLLSQGTYYVKEISRNGNIAYVVVCHPTIGARFVLLHWREAGYRAEIVENIRTDGCQAAFEEYDAEPESIEFTFGERVFTVADLQSFPRG